MNRPTGTISGIRLLVLGAFLTLPLVVVVLLVFRGGEENTTVAAKSQFSEKPTESTNETTMEDLVAENEDEDGGNSYIGSGPSFLSLDEMVATADLVVTGTVSDARSGEVVEYTDEMLDPFETDNAVTLDVNEVLKGADPGANIIVTTDQFGFTGPANIEWRRKGEPVLLFLWEAQEKEAADEYSLAGFSVNQTVYSIRNRNLNATANDTLSKRVEKLSMPELRRAVKEAKVKTRKGEVKPLKF
ncbi:MAG: hypothetical protein WKF67_06400 [Rubrobacteraceae bacterium]